MVWFTLLDKPPITSPDAPPENNLKQAVEALEKKVKSFDFRVYWKNPGENCLTLCHLLDLKVKYKISNYKDFD